MVFDGPAVGLRAGAAADDGAGAAGGADLAAGGAVFGGYMSVLPFDQHERPTPIRASTLAGGAFFGGAISSGNSLGVDDAALDLIGGEEGTPLVFGCALDNTGYMSACDVSQGRCDSSPSWPQEAALPALWHHQPCTVFLPLQTHP